MMQGHGAQEQCRQSTLQNGARMGPQAAGISLRYSCMGQRATSRIKTGSSQRRRQILWGSVVLLAAYGWQKWEQIRGVALINPPFCAWRFVGNHDAWNIAFPDMRSKYHVMQMNLNPGDVYKIVAESFPYARYMSYQTYDLRDFMSRQSLRDRDIVPERGSNAYANLSAAVRGEKQGGYTIYITAHGDHNMTNELAALAPDAESGHFDVFYRIYVEEAEQGPPQAPWAHKPPYDNDYAYEWGWAPPPRVYVKRAYRGKEEFHEIPVCRYRRRTGFKILAYLSEIWRAPANPFPDNTPSGPNKNGNVFLPKYTDRIGKFASKDANYLASVAEIDKSQQVWARFRGHLPTTPGGLYAPPYIANVSDYDVRYASINSVHRTIPFRGHGTLSDTVIEEKYRAKYGASWNGEFTIWVVPPDVQSYPVQVQADDALILSWGKSLWHGRSIAQPGLIFRQVMARGQVLEEGQGDASGIINVVPEKCAAHQRGGEQIVNGQIAQDDFDQLDQVCCGLKAPMECFQPAYVEHRMGPYYPRAEFFAGNAEGPLKPLQLPDATSKQKAPS